MTEHEFLVTVEIPDTCTTCSEKKLSCGNLHIKRWCILIILSVVGLIISLVFIYHIEAVGTTTMPIKRPILYRGFESSYKVYLLSAPAPSQSANLPSVDPVYHVVLTPRLHNSILFYPWPSKSYYIYNGNDDDVRFYWSNAYKQYMFFVPHDDSINTIYFMYPRITTTSYLDNNVTSIRGDIIDQTSSQPLPIDSSGGQLATTWYVGSTKDASLKSPYVLVISSMQCTQTIKPSHDPIRDSDGRSHIEVHITNPQTLLTTTGSGNMRTSDGVWISRYIDSFLYKNAAIDINMGSDERTRIGFALQGPGSIQTTVESIDGGTSQLTEIVLKGRTLLSNVHENPSTDVSGRCSILVDPSTICEIIMTPVVALVQWMSMATVCIPLGFYFLASCQPEGLLFGIFGEMICWVLSVIVRFVCRSVLPNVMAAVGIMVGEESAQTLASLATANGFNGIPEYVCDWFSPKDSTKKTTQQCDVSNHGKKYDLPLGWRCHKGYNDVPVPTSGNKAHQWYQCPCNCQCCETVREACDSNIKCKLDPVMGHPTTKCEQDREACLEKGGCSKDKIDTCQYCGQCTAPAPPPYSPTSTYPPAPPSPIVFLDPNTMHLPCSKGIPTCHGYVPQKAEHDYSSTKTCTTAELSDISWCKDVGPWDSDFGCCLMQTGSCPEGRFVEIWKGAGYQKCISGPLTTFGKCYVDSGGQCTKSYKDTKSACCGQSEDHDGKPWSHWNWWDDIDGEYGYECGPDAPTCTGYKMNRNGQPIHARTWGKCS